MQVGVCDVAAFLFAGADISEVEHMTNVDVAQLKFDGAVSGSIMGFMVQLSLECWLWSCMCAELLQVTALKLPQKQSEPVVAAQSDPYQQAGASTLQSLETFFGSKLQKKLVEVDMVQAMTDATTTCGQRAQRCESWQHS